MTNKQPYVTLVYIKGTQRGHKIMTPTQQVDNFRAAVRHNARHQTADTTQHLTSMIVRIMDDGALLARRHVVMLAPRINDQARAIVMDGTDDAHLAAAINLMQVTNNILRKYTL